MPELFDEYGSIILSAVAAAIVIALVITFITKDSMFSEWVTNFAQSLYGK